MHNRVSMGEFTKAPQVAAKRGSQDTLLSNAGFKAVIPVIVM